MERFDTSQEDYVISGNEVEVTAAVYMTTPRKNLKNVSLA
jgi:hypothetical protein